MFKFLSSEHQSYSLLFYALFLLGFIFNGSILQAQKATILSHKELAKQQFTTPYILDFQKENKALLFIGSQHSNDPADSLFVRIKDLLTVFKPSVAFNEGGLFKIYSTADSTIRYSWEPGYLRYLCKEANIPIESIEPSQEEEYDFILEKYTTEEVFLFYGYRQADQLKRQVKNTPSINIEERLNLFLTSIGQEIFDEEAADYPAKFRTLYKEKFKFAFAFGQLSSRFFAPTAYFTNLSQINRSIGDFRDHFIIDKIKQAFETYDRIFIVMGAGHAVRQERVWEEYFEK